MSFADSMQDLENTNAYAEPLPARTRPSFIERVVHFIGRMVKPSGVVTRATN
jgi:hypothetical protein